MKSSGFHQLNIELAKYSERVNYEFFTMDFAVHRTAIDEEALQKSFRQIFSSSANPNDDGLRLSTEEYIKYKKRYVKHLQFDPDIQNLSKFSTHFYSFTAPLLNN